jgi:hypothetical protein
MSTFRRGGTTGPYDIFYWIGVIMALACVGLAFAGNVEAFWRFEHTGFPVSWALGLMAILAFLGAELCPPASEVSDETEEELSTAPEWET